MKKTKEQIASEISKHFEGFSFRECYVGITSNVQTRLFNDHSVSKEYGHWIYVTAGSSDDARAVERYFLKAGMDGGSGGGDVSSMIIYAYKKMSYTNP